MNAKVKDGANLTKSFIVIWVGQAFSLFGSRLVQFALVWHLTRTTGSATVLAIATLVAMLPTVVMGPFIGALVDRWNRRLIMIVADSLIAVSTIGLAYLFWADSVQVWHIWLIMFLRGLGQAFHEPAMMASTSLMVPEEHLARVNGFNQMLQGLMAVIAPVVGALAVVALPMQAVLAIDVLTAAIAVGILLAVRIPQPERAVGVKTSPLADTLEGLRYVWSWTGLMIILVMATLLNLLFVPAFSLLPILVVGHFGGGAAQLSWFEAAVGLGFIVGGITLGVWGGFRRKIMTSLLGLLGAGLFMSGVGLLGSGMMALGIGLTFLVGVSMPIVNGPMIAILQAKVAPEKQGRVIGLVGTLSGGAAPLGLALAGPVSDAVGVQAWFLVAGAAALIMPLALVFIPAVMNIEAQGGGVAAGAAVNAPEAATAD